MRTFRIDDGLATVIFALYHMLPEQYIEVQFDAFIAEHMHVLNRESLPIEEQVCLDMMRLCQGGSENDAKAEAKTDAKAEAKADAHGDAESEARGEARGGVSGDLNGPFQGGSTE